MFCIGDNILIKTDKCKNSYSCLDGDIKCLCEVQECIENSIIYINPHADCTCNYKISYGYNYVCNCPVRKEIYKLYRK